MTSGECSEPYKKIDYYFQNLNIFDNLKYSVDQKDIFVIILISYKYKDSLCTVLNKI